MQLSSFEVMLMKPGFGTDFLSKNGYLTRWDELIFWRHFSPSALAKGSRNSKVIYIEQRGSEDAKEQQAEKRTTHNFLYFFSSKLLTG